MRHSKQGAPGTQPALHGGGPSPLFSSTTFQLSLWENLLTSVTSLRVFAQQSGLQGRPERGQGWLLSVRSSQGPGPPGTAQPFCPFWWGEILLCFPLDFEADD